MSLDFLDTYEKYVHEDKKEDVSSDNELFQLDKVEETQAQTNHETASSHLSDEDIERIAKKLAEMQQVNVDEKADEGGNEDGC